MLNNFSTASLEAELEKRKALEELESVIRRTLENGFTPTDIRNVLTRVSGEKRSNIRGS